MISSNDRAKASRAPDISAEPSPGRAIPLTTPGRAIGRTRKNEIVWRPKKLNRCTATAARVPRTRASMVAVEAASSELTSALVTAGFDAASPNQWNVKLTGGHAWRRLELNA